jgi:hypothetical protein
MQDNLPVQPVSPESLARKHESQDPPIRGILLVAGAVVLTTVICLATIWAIMDRLSSLRPMSAASRELGIISAPGLGPLERFPSPTLQIIPHDDLLALRAREEQELSSYGWLDRTTGVVRIPIQRALDLLAERGLPAAATNGLQRGPSSLQLIQERSQTR